MNIRRQKYKQFRLEGYSAFASAIKAGYSRNTAINAGKNIESRCNFKELLEVEGLTDKILTAHAIEGLNANKVISANITYGDADSKTNDFIDIPDWNVRHKYFETILKLTDKLKDAPLIDQSQHTHLHFIKEAITKSGLINEKGYFRSREIVRSDK